MVRTYQIFAPDDTSEWKINTVREEYGWQGKWIYAILLDGNISIVQNEDVCPAKRGTIEESAKAHIKLLEDEEQAEIESAQREQAELEAKEKRQQQLEETVAKQTETLSQLTQLIAQMQSQMIAQANS